MVSSLVVFAFRRDALAFLDALPWLFMLLLAMGALVVAMYFLRQLKHWRLGDPVDEKQMLSQFRDLHKQGKLSAEEYRGVRFTLAEQMRRRAEEAERQE
jgi:hypothetical protein